MAYYLLYCDTDYYWKGSQQFCVDHGYDGLATAKDDEEFQYSIRTRYHRSYTPTDGSTREMFGLASQRQIVLRLRTAIRVSQVSTKMYGTTIGSMVVTPPIWRRTWVHTGVMVKWRISTQREGILVCTTMTSIVHT